MTQPISDSRDFQLTRRQLLAMGGRAALAAVAWSIGMRTQVLAAPASIPLSLPALREELAVEVAAFPGDVAVAITDLQTDETVSVNGDRPQMGACTSNLFMLYAVVEDLAAGAYPVEEVDWMLRAAVGASDPRWARELLIKVGRGSLANGVNLVAELMQRIGVTASVYDHAPNYWFEYSRTGGHNLITASDVNGALGKLYRRQLFDDSWTEYALAKLLDVRPRLNNMIPAQLPQSGVRVAHKVGFLNALGYSVRNDAGLVLLDRPEGQRAYAFTYLSENNRDYFGSASFAGGLSRKAFDYFSQLY